MKKLPSNKILRYLIVFLFNLNLSSIILLIRSGFSKFRRFFGLSNKLYFYLLNNSYIPSKEIYEIFNVEQIPEIKIIPSKSEGIETPIDEIAYLALITRVSNAKNIFEIGTFKGRTALNFALNSSDETIVYTMDLPGDNIDISTLGDADRRIALESNPELEYKGYSVSSKIKQIYANSLTYDFSNFYDRIDLMFIDGGHSFECVSNDTENALRMVKKGGIIIWHDFMNATEYYPVTKIIYDLKAKGYSNIYRIANTELCVLIKD